MGFCGANGGIFLPTMTTPSPSRHGSLMDNVLDENNVKNPNLGYIEDTEAAPGKWLVTVF